MNFQKEKKTKTEIQTTMGKKNKHIIAIQQFYKQKDKKLHKCTCVSTMYIYVIYRYINIASVNKKGFSEKKK